MEQLGFRTSQDTDVDAASAIQPLGAENASPAVLNRPLENLRQRTERAREAFNRLSLFASLVPSFFHTSNGGTQDAEDPVVDPSVDNVTQAWWRGAVPEDGPTDGSDNRGRITLSGSGATVGFRMLSMLGPGIARTSQDDITVADASGRGASTEERLPNRVLTDGVNSFRLTGGTLAAGGGQVWLRVLRATSSLEEPTVSVEGSLATGDDVPVSPGGRVITVTISRGDAGEGDVVTTIADVIDALNDDVAFIDAELVDGDDAEEAFEISVARLHWPVPAIELFISQTVLEAFWDASDENLLREGDALAVYFPTTAEFLAATTAGSGCNITVGQLVNVGRSAEAFSADAVLVPVARVVDNRLHLPGGGVITTAMSFTAVAGLSAQTIYVSTAGMGDKTIFGQTFNDEESVQIALGRVFQGAQALYSGASSLNYLGVGIANSSGAGDDEVSDARVVVRETRASSPQPAIGARQVLRKDVTASADGTLEEVGAIYSTLRDGGGKAGVAGLIRAAYVSGQLVWQVATNPVTNLGTAIDAAAGTFFYYDGTLTRHALRTGRAIIGTIADTLTGHGNGSGATEATLVRAQGTAATTAHADAAPSADLINSDATGTTLGGAAQLRLLMGKNGGAAGSLVEAFALRASRWSSNIARLDAFLNDGTNDSARALNPMLTAVPANASWSARLDVFGVSQLCIARGIFTQTGTDAPVLENGSGFGTLTRNLPGRYTAVVSALTTPSEVDSLNVYPRVTMLDPNKSFDDATDTTYAAQASLFESGGDILVSLVFVKTVAGVVTFEDGWSGGGTDAGFAVEVFVAKTI